MVSHADAALHRAADRITAITGDAEDVVRERLEVGAAYTIDAAHPFGHWTHPN